MLCPGPMVVAPRETARLATSACLTIRSLRITENPLCESKEYPPTYASPRSASRTARYWPAELAPLRAASSASDETAKSGQPMPSANPFAIDAAIRKLVKLPGPAPQITWESSWGETPARRITAAMAGMSASASRPLIVASHAAATRPSFNTAAVPVYVDASRAMVITRGLQTCPRRRGHRRTTGACSDHRVDVAAISARDPVARELQRAPAIR